MNIEFAQKVTSAFIKANVPIYLWGLAGIGKSTYLEELAEKEGYYLVDLRLATQEVSDLIGIPYTEKVMVNVIVGRDDDDKPIIQKQERSVTAWAMPHWASTICDKAAQGIKTMLFADEHNRANKEVANVFYQVLTKKQIHEHQLPKDMVIVAAGNPPTEDYNVETSDIAMLTRFGHIEIDCDPNVWLEQYGSRMDPDISGFIAVAPDALHKPGAKFDIGAFQQPCPRGWEFVNRIYKAIGPNDKQLLQVCIGALVGRAAATQYMAFLDKNWVKIEDILNGKSDMEKMLADPEGNLQLIRLSHEIMQHMTNKHFTINTKDKSLIETRKKNFIKFIGELCKVKKELAVAICKVLGTRDPQLLRMLITESKEIGEVTKMLASSMRSLF